MLFNKLFGKSKVNVDSVKPQQLKPQQLVVFCGCIFRIIDGELVYWRRVKDAEDLEKLKKAYE